MSNSMDFHCPRFIFWASLLCQQPTTLFNPNLTFHCKSTLTRKGLPYFQLDLHQLKKSNTQPSVPPKNNVAAIFFQAAPKDHQTTFAWASFNCPLDIAKFGNNNWNDCKDLNSDSFIFTLTFFMFIPARTAAILLITGVYYPSTKHPPWRFPADAKLKHYFPVSQPRTGFKTYIRKYKLI